MPSAIPDEIRERTIKQWLSRDTRATIASDNNIGEGSVTNIVGDFNKRLADSEFESIRQVAVESRKQGLTPSDLGSSLRLYHFIKKLGANQDQIESFIATLANSPELEKVIDRCHKSRSESPQLSRSESIRLEREESHIKQMVTEEEIKRRRS